MSQLAVIRRVPYDFGIRISRPRRADRTTTVFWMTKLAARA